MGFLTLPAVILVIMFPGFTPAHRLADFGRLADAQDEEVAIVDMFGTERLGRVVAATAASVTLGFGTGTRTFDRADVLKADRLRDGTRDGIIKGLLIGSLVGLAVAMEAPDHGKEGFLTAVAVYGGLGYALDRANTNRAPLYRQ